ncbi:O-methylsterigmatocystin oxidoreductase [Leucoagaricus sp. SymC.cos]|nr:O-methylsterigmatocystin oxidoreductase [Leucoagaricus sp. SymC.cos]
MECVYGREIKTLHDPFFETAEIAMLSLSVAGVPGEFYVDAFPFLKHLPSWFPGAGFRKQAAEWARYVHSLRTDTFASLKEKMERGAARPCIAKAMLEQASHDGDSAVEIIQDATGIAFGAGVDTGIAAALIFFLAMALYPDAQQTAQAELDAIVGRNRLPDFDDQPNLPYINALCKEVLRWQNVVPLSVAHATSKDDVYEGFFIPKGSVVVPNVWAVTHDPEAYSEPQKFMPGHVIPALQSDVVGIEAAT